MQNCGCGCSLPALGVDHIIMDFSFVRTIGLTMQIGSDLLCLLRARRLLRASSRSNYSQDLLKHGENTSTRLSSRVGGASDKQLSPLL